MNIPTIIPIYTALLALGYFVLSLRVSFVRREFSIGLGDGGNTKLERAIRAHANFAEYVPITLLLLAALEFQGAPAWLLHFFCIVLIIGRVLHAVGISPENDNLLFRKLGMVCTLTPTVLAAFVLLIKTPALFIIALLTLPAFIYYIAPLKPSK